MPTRSELMDALRNADAAGDTEAATRFAGMIDALPADEDYGNEGRRVAPAAAQEPVQEPSTGAKILKAALGAPKMYGQIQKDTLVGMGKAARDFIEGLDKTVLDVAPTRVEYDPKYKSEESKTLDKMYEEAGPAAAGGRLLQEIAMTGGPAEKAGALVASKVGPKFLQKALGGATAGATGGALLPPGEDETRAGNALQGAAFGGALGVGGAALAPAARYLSELAPTAGKSARRTVRVLEKALGRPQMDSISANLDNPRALPMTTAAASQSPGLAQIEQQTRGKITPKDRPKWERLDERTSQAAWNEFQDATSRGQNLDVVKSTLDDAWEAIQNRIDKLPIGPRQREMFAQDLQNLADSPLFGASTGSKQVLQRLAAEGMNDANGAGALLRYRRQELDKLPMSPEQKEALGAVLDQHLDKLSKGAWGKFQTALPQMERDFTEAAAANRMTNDFMSEGGVVRGRTGNEIPRVTSDRLRNAQNKQIANRGTLEADVQLNDQDRVALERLNRALQQAEYPRSVPAGDPIDTGSVADALGNLPTSNTTGRAIRALLRVVTGARDDAQTKALAVALRSPDGWKKIMSMGDKEISASDAKMLANILRASSGAGTATTSD